MQVNGLSGAGSKTVGIKMAQKMDSFSINIKNEIARKQKEQQEISSNKSLSYSAGRLQKQKAEAPRFLFNVAQTLTALRMALPTRLSHVEHIFITAV